MKRGLGSALLMLAAVLGCLFAVSAFADSQARIVRVSDVQGSVQIDRATGQGYEKAFLNMPITQGVKLKTGDDGRAEVEFEDGSIIHLVPNSALQFTELGLRDSGGKVSTVNVDDGQAYFDFTAKKGDELTVTFQHEKASLTHEAHFRVKVEDTSASVAVFKGDVQVDGPSGEVKLAKKETASFDFADNDKYTVAKNIESDPYDSWDKQQAQYHERYQASNTYGAPYSYGLSDLNYYGNYMNVPGYGMCWQPYFTGMGWNPYMDGAWMWYPGFGYSWVSAYPWGWMPYHYGSWLFVPSLGWLWQPGNTWVAWNGVPAVINPPRNFIPPRPPAVTGRPLVTVGRGPTVSTLNPGTRPGSRVVISEPNAGLGVPRGLHNLGRANQQFETHGQARVGVPSGSRGAAMTGMPSRSVGMGNAGMGSSRMGAPVGRMSTGGRTTSSGSHSSSSNPHR